jgi:predicted dehydrogenase
MNMTKIGVGLYGGNGHQIYHQLQDHPGARLVAIASVDAALLPAKLRDDPELRRYESLDDLLCDPRVELVSLCSPRRRDQARDAIAALRAGKHVYAEKPCAMTEEDLDAILDASQAAGKQFHEMAGSAFAQPFLAMRKIVRSGALGEIVQVFGQKSYPYHERRPQDEELDGGLIGQASVHAVRWVGHVACVRITDVRALETTFGNPVAGGGLRMAAVLMMKLDNGGVGAIVANYLNPRGVGTWGNEAFRIWGTRGMLEATDGGTRTRLVIGDQDHGPIDTTSEPSRDYFDFFIDSIQTGAPMPLSLEEELHPTRVVIRAKRSV